MINKQITNPQDQSYAQFRSLIPFVLPPVLPTTRNTKMGRGVLCPVTAAANTPVTVVHNLGRKVQGMFAILNNAGADYNPQLKFGGGPSTNIEQSIEGNVVMTNCFVFFF